MVCCSDKLDLLTMANASHSSKCIRGAADMGFNPSASGYSWQLPQLSYLKLCQGEHSAVPLRQQCWLRSLPGAAGESAAVKLQSCASTLQDKPPSAVLQWQLISPAEDEARLHPQA